GGWQAALRRPPDARADTVRAASYRPARPDARRSARPLREMAASAPRVLRDATRPRRAAPQHEVNLRWHEGKPHPEEAAKRLSRRTHGVAPASAHFRSSTRAMARLWTSSGPSTMRMMRERAQA